MLRVAYERKLNFFVSQCNIFSCVCRKGAVHRWLKKVILVKAYRALRVDLTSHFPVIMLKPFHCHMFLTLVMLWTAEEALDTFSKHPAYVRVCSVVCVLKSQKCLPFPFESITWQFLAGLTECFVWFFPFSFAGFHRESPPHQCGAVICRFFGRPCDQIVTSLNLRWRTSFEARDYYWWKFLSPGEKCRCLDVSQIPFDWSL